MIVLQVTLWVMLFAQVSGDIGVRKSGPYNIVVEQITRCDEEGTGEMLLGTKITRTSDGKYVYTNPVYSKYDVDQDMKINFELQSFSNGGYRPRYMHHTFKGCEEIWKYAKDAWKRGLESAGFVGQTCPVPAGNYSVKNIDMNDIQLSAFPVMIYNKYKTVGTFYYKGKKVGCIQVYIEVVPK